MRSHIYWQKGKWIETPTNFSARSSKGAPSAMWISVQRCFQCLREGIAGPSGRKAELVMSTTFGFETANIHAVAMSILPASTCVDSHFSAQAPCWLLLLLLKLQISTNPDPLLLELELSNIVDCKKKRNVHYRLYCVLCWQDITNSCTEYCKSIVSWQQATSAQPTQNPIDLSANGMEGWGPVFTFSNAASSWKKVCI